METSEELQEVLRRSAESRRRHGVDTDAEVFLEEGHHKVASRLLVTVPCGDRLGSESLEGGSRRVGGALRHRLLEVRQVLGDPAGLASDLHRGISLGIKRDTPPTHHQSNGMIVD